jgi:tricorn protease interacting factor F2/3
MMAAKRREPSGTFPELVVPQLRPAKQVGMPAMALCRPTVRSGEMISPSPSLRRQVLEYDLALDIDFPTSTFRGTVEISGFPGTDAVELDSVDLTIASADVGGRSVPFALDGRSNKLVIPRPNALKEPIRIAFSGIAPDGIQTGFFACRLGSTKALTTQMEPESCRRLLPCLDRPDRKAVFRLRVSTESGLTVISNMPSASRPLPDGRTEWRFEPTPPMSTYLFYLGVGAFEETTDNDGPVPIVVAAPVGKRAQAQRTAGIARTTLRGFSDYFDVPYPLPKLHFVVLSDFWAGMENWGAISGSESHYLIDDTSSPSARQYGEQTIVHEIAHQWFGDLVTLRTWDDLWLNEAFATFAVPLVQESTHLREDPWAEFVTLTEPADRTDALWSTHPVKPSTYVAAEVMATADHITYFKGARLLRMIEKFLGRDRFRDGVSEYLRDHRFGNAASDDLWEALEEEAQQPVSKIMRPWVERPGHPCITVRQVGSHVELSQQRFSYVPRDEPDPPWPIPLTWAKGDESHSVLFDTARMTLEHQEAANLCIDPGRTGFFRILWAPELRAGLTGKLPSLSVPDRRAFLHDAYGFLLSGDYSLPDYTAAVRAASSVTDRLTTEEVANSLNILEPVLWDVPAFCEAARHYCAAQRGRISETASPGEPEASDVVREAILWVSARVDGTFARTLADRFAHIDEQPPALQQAIATAFARCGDPGSADRLLARAVAPDSDAATIACTALGESPNPAHLVRIFDEALATARIADTLAFLVPSGGRNPSARPALWDWLTHNLREIERRSVGSYLLAECLERTLPNLGIGRAGAVKQFFERESFPEALPAVRRSLELLEAHERLRSRIGRTALPQRGD